MRRLLGLVGSLACVVLIACGDDDGPTPEVDSGPQTSDAAVDSGVDAQADAETDAASDTDADTDVDAAALDDAAPPECVISVEVCDGIDNDCDANIDESLGGGPWYRDLDGDGFGDPNSNGVVVCSVIAGHSLLGTDCDDTNGAVHPNSDEICDEVDNNCSGAIDEGLSCPVACDPVCVGGAECVDALCVCAAGYVDVGATGCAPTLTALTVSSGTLSPALSDAVTDYAVFVGLSVEAITFTPTVPASATITINNAAAVSGQAWQSPTLSLGLNLFELVVQQSGRPSRSYTLSVTRGGSQRAYVKASNSEAFDQFGNSVAVSGDTLVVGASYEASSATGINGDASDNQAPYSGAVYVFVRNGSSWEQQAYLKASNAEAGDLFGGSVAISGDLLVVGASREGSNAIGIDGDQSNNGVTNAGAAYVFTRSGSTWTQTAYLKASNTGLQDEFGFSVAASGDTVVVGARNEASAASGIDADQSNNSSSAAGAAYVFVRSEQGVWSQQAYIKASNPGGSDQFGKTLALSDDTLVVGAAGEDSSATGIDGDQASSAATNSGAVYVFERSDTMWTQAAYVKASNTGAGDSFGISVAVSGDTFVVGASGEDSDAIGIGGGQATDASSNSGAAYVFVRSQDVWSQQAYIKASNTGAEDLFGTSVAIADDRVVVGAPYEDSNAREVDGDQTSNSRADSGAAYVFARDVSTWSQVAYLKANNADPSDWFGSCAAASGDNLAVTAFQEDSTATGVNGNHLDNTALSAGAVYLFQ